MSISHNTRILLIHNTYLEKGGEDTVVKCEWEFLKKQGAAVYYKEFNNASFTKFNPSAWLLPLTITFNLYSFFSLFFFIRYKKIKIVHVHNFFYNASPSVFWAAKLAGAKTILTIHNYRLFCLKYNFFRNNVSCFDCYNNQSFKKGIQEKCFKSSYLASAALAFSLNFHQWTGTWKKKVDCYIVLNKFTANLLLQGKRIPEHKIVYKPNFLSTTDYTDYSNRQDFYFFSGRLSEEKGIRHMLEAFTLVQKKLIIAGSGELAPFIQQHQNEYIQYIGSQTHAEIRSFLVHCKALILPSLWIESMPMTILEAQSCGTIAIASTSMNTAEMITDGKDGLLYQSGNPVELANKILYLESMEREKLNCMSADSYKKFINLYTEAAHLKKINEIYGV